MKSLRLPSSSGFTLIEVMIAILILAFGVLGLAGLQARSITAENESYSRAQAILLLQDMTTRLSANTAGFSAGDYAHAGVVFGTGYAGSDPDCDALTTPPVSAADVADTDVCAWSEALKNATNVNAARGCIEAGSVANEVLVSVAWQGRDSSVTPTVDQPCASAAITNGRRVVSQRVR
ncbi:MAG TPA: type IV pilus modification protein PilV, partial [Azospira sp.]|nr:type IV pilus modification protein PilV [Azospira sp.]